MRVGLALLNLGVQNKPRIIVSAQKKFGKACGQMIPLFEQIALLAMFSIYAEIETCASFLFGEFG